MPRSPALSLTTLALLSMLLGLPGSPGGAGAQEATASIEGRWRGEILKSKPYRLNPITIDIAPCDNAICGRAVEANGSCGPVILRLMPASSGKLEGDLTLPESTFRARVLRDEEFLILQVLTWEEPMSRFTRMMPAESAFSPAGPASCPPAVSWRRHPFPSSAAS